MADENLAILLLTNAYLLATIGQGLFRDVPRLLIASRMKVGRALPNGSAEL